MSIDAAQPISFYSSLVCGAPTPKDGIVADAFTLARPDLLMSLSIE